jgi:hypothetical protein
MASTSVLTALSGRAYVQLVPQGIRICRFACIFTAMRVLRAVLLHVLLAACGQTCLGVPRKETPLRPPIFIIGTMKGLLVLLLSSVYILAHHDTLASLSLLFQNIRQGT